MDPTVFVSYRFGDVNAAAAEIAAGLEKAFGTDHVFFDLVEHDHRSFEEVFGEQLAVSTVLVAIIGPSWCKHVAPSGRRRLDIPRDWVRREIESAYRASMPVIPVYVDDAPGVPRDIVDGLGELERLPDEWHHRYRSGNTDDLERLVHFLRREAPEHVWRRITPQSSARELVGHYQSLTRLDPGGVVDTRRFFSACRPDIGEPPTIEYINLPEGTFLLGSAGSELRRYGDEGPQQLRRISPFAIAARPLTVSQYQAYAPDHIPDRAERSDDAEFQDHPVTALTWWDAYLVCAWLGARLPTEAEWEYACRAGTTTQYYFGDSAEDLDRHSWYFNTSGGNTRPVGLLPANPWGLFDMIGNTQEWCRDHYQPWHEQLPDDGSPFLNGDERLRVLRGGCWYFSKRTGRSAFRRRSPADFQDNSTGVRPARSIDE